MPGLNESDVEIKVHQLTRSAQEMATKLGHAAAICRRGAQFFVADSWQPVEGAHILRLVSVSGVSVKQ